MPKMTRERARFLIVDALADAWTGDGKGCLAQFNAGGLATDDETTTWADVFAAADLRGWSNAQSAKADTEEALHAK